MKSELGQGRAEVMILAESLSWLSVSFVVATGGGDVGVVTWGGGRAIVPKAGTTPVASRTLLGWLCGRGFWECGHWWSWGLGGSVRLLNSGLSDYDSPSGSWQSLQSHLRPDDPCGVLPIPVSGGGQRGWPDQVVSSTRISQLEPSTEEAGGEPCAGCSAPRASLPSPIGAQWASKVSSQGLLGNGLWPGSWDHVVKKVLEEDGIIRTLKMQTVPRRWLAHWQIWRRKQTQDQISQVIVPSRFSEERLWLSTLSRNGTECTQANPWGLESINCYLNLPVAWVPESLLPLPVNCRGNLS